MDYCISGDVISFHKSSVSFAVISVNALSVISDALTVNGQRGSLNALVRVESDETQPSLSRPVP